MLKLLNLIWRGKINISAFVLICQNFSNHNFALYIGTTFIRTPEIWNTLSTEYSRSAYKFIKPCHLAK